MSNRTSNAIQRVNTMKLKWLREDGHKFVKLTCRICECKMGFYSRKGDFSRSLPCLRVQAMMFSQPGATRTTIKRWQS